MILFIANRFLKSRKNSSGFSIFSLIAILGIAVGVASLIIAINVLDGFDLTIREKVENLDSHIQIVGFSDLPINEKDSTDKRVKELIPNQLVHIDKYVSRLVIAGTKKIKEGVQLKGVGADYFRKKEGLKIIEGERNLS
ncbi:MAG TPA: ABC transporter permease, partial [Ignavibacteriaceae bacterium]|nr:ABC transporter permease [Ignavibacteriaceae bacterium]